MNAKTTAITVAAILAATAIVGLVAADLFDAADARRRNSNNDGGASNTQENEQFIQNQNNQQANQPSFSCGFCAFGD
jgi:uncharacterized membrane protein YdfJ with MMPL/SSD domain